MIPTFEYGKHKGKSVEWVIFHDPAYITWLAQTRSAWWSIPWDVKERLRTICHLADNLLIPGGCAGECGRPVSRMLLVKGMSGHLVKVEFVCDHCNHDGGLRSVACRPSLFHSEVFRDYDKAGAKVLVEAIWRAYNGPDAKNRTPQRMERFFADRRNFHV